MPTYEYRCSAGHEFEQFQRMSEAPLDRCTVCGAPAERILSAGAGLLFKGSGFYITDYRSDSYRKAAEADKGASQTDGGSKADGPAKADAGKKPDAGKADAGRKPDAGKKGGESKSSGGSSGGGTAA